MIVYGTKGTNLRSAVPLSVPLNLRSAVTLLDFQSHMCDYGKKSIKWHTVKEFSTDTGIPAVFNRGNTFASDKARTAVTFKGRTWRPKATMKQSN